MRNVLSNFQSPLDRIRALANHIASDTAAALGDSKIRDLHETQQCGAVVLLSGYFEAFLKDLVRKYIEDLSGSGVAFDALPQPIRDCHFEGGGKVLSKASEASRKGRPTPFGNATREDIVARLHSAASGGGAYQIVWEAFADTEANPAPDVVKGIAKNLGVANFWPTIASKSQDPAQWSDTAITSKLSDLIAKRNECAHTGKVSPVPTVTEILDFADMLTALGTGFVSTLEEQLLAYAPA